MPFLNSLFGLVKKLTLFILIVAIAIPLGYGSTSPKYLIVRFIHSILSLKHALLSDQTRPTLSADYRAFENLLRLNSKPKRDPTTDSLTTVREFRSVFTFESIVPQPSQCQVNKEVFHHDGHSVDAYWVDYSSRKFQRNTDKLILYFHGGGYIAGDIHGELFDILRFIIRSIVLINTIDKYMCFSSGRL
jgi:acetyl esterase/lipase